MEKRHRGRGKGAEERNFFPLLPTLHSPLYRLISRQL